MHYKERNRRRGRLFALALAITILFSNAVVATANATELGSAQPHSHQWDAAWSYDEVYHWHDCNEVGCPAEDTEKDGYEKHIFTDDGVCIECQYVNPIFSTVGASETTDEKTTETPSDLTDNTPADNDQIPDEVDSESSEDDEDEDDSLDDEDEDFQDDSNDSEDSDSKNDLATDADENDTDSGDKEDDDSLGSGELEESNPLVNSVLAVSADLDELPAEDSTTAQIAAQSDLVIDIPDVSPPTTYQEVYDRMIAMQAILPDGMRWDDDTPYGSLGPLGDHYIWKGGMINGSEIYHTGCSALAAILSDSAFGSLPGRIYYNGSFTFDDVRPGDILRRLNHTVIVLQKGTGGVIVAEGNLSDSSAGVKGSVHWGRVIPAWEVTDSTYMITRYPENFVSADEEGANEEIDSGSLGSIQWSLTGSGTLTISGNGSIPDFTDDNPAPWFTHNAQISSIEIQSGITKIGDYAFYQSNAMSVTIGGSVSSIGINAFNGSKIIEVAIPGAVQSIDDGAFRDCQNLVTLSLSEGLNLIGENAFSGCSKLNMVSLPSTITTVKTGAFKDCREMWQAVFAASSQKVTIGDDIFSRCWSLNSVTLPLKADCIGGGMFGSCGLLTELFIPSGIEWIKSNDSLSGSPFMGCDALKVINFEGSESEWNSRGGPNAITYGGRVGKTTVNFNVSATETPSEHQHIWSTAWEHDDNYHWHECTDDCPITNNSQKSSYGAHTGEWIIEKEATADQAGSRYRECTICKFRQTEIIAATGSDSDNESDTDDTGSTDKDTGTGTDTDTGNSKPDSTGSNTDNTESNTGAGTNEPNQPGSSDSGNSENSSNNSAGNALSSSTEESSSQNPAINSLADFTIGDQTSVNSELDALLNASGLGGGTKPTDPNSSLLSLLPKSEEAKQTNVEKQELINSDSILENEDDKNDSKQVAPENGEDSQSAQDSQNIQGQSITDSEATASKGKSMSDILLLGVAFCGGAIVISGCLYQATLGKTKVKFDGDSVEDLDEESEDE